jgi:enoyl-CoA hydratase
VHNPFAPELLLDELGDDVVEVTLNRPAELNATNKALHDGLIAVWEHLDQVGCRAAVLTGAGKAFSAGGDMAHLKAVREDRSLRRREIEGAGHLVRAMLACPLPIVAAVNGPAVGLGASLAALCDIVFIAEDAFFADPHVSVGLTAADGGAPLWPLLMSLLKAKEYLLTGDRIPAAVAVELGLANHAVPAADLLPRARELATRLAKQPPQALRSTKRALNMHAQRAVAGVLEYALSEEYNSLDQPEHQAIVDGFLARHRS